MSWSDLSRREKQLCIALGLMMVLMYLSHQHELIGVDGALVCSWIALGVFLGVLVLFLLPEGNSRNGVR
ncbi:hypothetical protein [Derxia gummosa]|uniref:Uncharacterized protein n=1 Tax=Derxia gummosa DSM 723 TaxID=1121388 RepID=A0A8B6X1W4_9BURK|nr:hypothetical protein [Derxia gummosa]